MAAIQELVGEIRVDSSGVKRGVDDANQGLGKLESSAVSAGESMKSVGRTATMGLTAPIVAGMGAAAKSAADFETQMTEVEKVTDPATANRMGEAIKNMAAEMPVAHKELATIAETAGRLGVSSEHLEGFTRNVAKMAAATDLTAEEAADSFARISTLMEYPIEKSEELGSAMNELSNSFGTSTSEITDVMTRAGGAFNALGLGTDQALGLAAAMNEVSPSSRLAAGGLKRISEMLMDPKKVNKIADAFGMTSQELQKMIKNDPSGVIEMLAKEMQTGSDVSQQLRSDLGKQASELTTLGSNWEAVEGATSMANEQLKEGTSLQKEFDAASSTLNSQLQITKNQFRNVGIALGEALLPYLSTFNDILQGVAKRLMNMSSAQRSVLLGVAALVAAIGPLLFVFGTILTMVPSMVAGWGAITAALSGGLIPALAGAASTITGALAPALSVLLGPIGIAIGAIALLAAAWATDFGGIRGHTMRVVSVLKEEFGPAVAWLRDAAAPILSFLGSTGVSALSSLASAVAPLVGIIADGLIVAIRALGAIGRAVFQGISIAATSFRENTTYSMQDVRTAVALLQQGLQLAGQVIGGILTRMQEWWSVWGSTVMNITQMAGRTVLAVIRGIADFLTTVLLVALQIMMGDWQGAWNTMEAYLQRTAASIRAIVSGWTAAIRGLFVKLEKDAGLSAGRLRDSVVGFFASLKGRAIAHVRAWKAQTAAEVTRLRAQVEARVGQMADRVVGFFAGLKNRAIARAQQLRAQFVRQVARLKARAQSQVDSMVDNLVGFVRGGISRFKRAGRALISAFADGIEEKIGAVETSVKDAVGAARRYLPGSDAEEGPLSDISQTGPALVDTFADGIESERGRVEHAARTIAEAARDELNTEATMQLGVKAAQRERAETAATDTEPKRADDQPARQGWDEMVSAAVERAGEYDGKAVRDVLSNFTEGDLFRLSEEVAKGVDKIRTSGDDQSLKTIENPFAGDTRGLYNTLKEVRGGQKEMGQVLYDMLSRSGDLGVYDELRDVYKKSVAAERAGKVQAEDGTWVDPSYYNRTADPAAKMDSGGKQKQQADRSEPLIDFSNLPEDAYVSVDALRTEMEQVAKNREHDVIKSATDGDFTF